jgi:hypothetical protein
VVFVGPGSARETLVDVDRPHHFDYRLTDPSGPLAALVKLVDGTWRFEPAGTGVRITWSWEVHPRNAVTAALLPLLAWFWRRYADAALARLQELLSPVP